LTEHLSQEARRVERACIEGAGGDPDFSPLYDSPFDGKPVGFRLVTEPELGLQRVAKILPDSGE
jgi:hypothetical protein